MPTSHQLPNLSAAVVDKGLYAYGHGCKRLMLTASAESCKQKLCSCVQSVIFLLMTVNRSGAVTASVGLQHSCKGDEVVWYR